MSRTIRSIGNREYTSGRQRRCKYKLRKDKKKKREGRGNGLINKYDVREDGGQL
jgi:hypothetical protein